MNDYMIVYRQFKRGRRSLKTAYALASCNKEAKMAAQNWLAEAEPLGVVMFIRRSA